MRKLLYGLIAVALIFGCISDIFATDYKQMGKVYPQGNFSSDCFTKITEGTLVANATSVTMNNLASNTTIEYKFDFMGVATDNTYGYLLFNNDTSVGHYGYQYLDGTSTTVSARRDATNPGLYFYANNAGVSQASATFYGKSGYARTSIFDGAFTMSGTTVTQIILWGHSWTDTSAEITSMTIQDATTNGLRIGTYYCLWGKEYKQ